MRFLVGLMIGGGIVAAALPLSRSDIEHDRLQRHFATVLAELEARDVSGLTLSQRVARSRHIERLRAYARRGVFPKNTDFASAVPYFVDRDGTRCAMAFLIEQSGQAAYVRAVAAQMNNALVGQIARDAELGPSLATWLNANGLTLAEAARIQPSYCSSYVRPPRYVPGFPVTRSTTYYDEHCRMGMAAALMRFTTGTSAMILTTVNLTGLSEGKARRTTAAAGIAVGVLGGLLLLGDHIGTNYGEIEHSGRRGLTEGAAILGGISILAGVYAFLTPGSTPEPAQVTAETARVRATPWVEPGGAGLALQIRF